MSLDNLHCVTDLTSWPTLRCLTRELLSQVHQFYYIGSYFFLVCRDGTVHEGEVSLIPTAPLDLKAFRPLLKLSGLELVNISVHNSHRTVLTKSGELYYWNGNEKGDPRVLACNVSQICFGRLNTVLLYRDGKVVAWRHYKHYSGDNFNPTDTMVELIPATRGVTQIECYGEISLAYVPHRDCIYVWGQLEANRRMIPSRVPLPSSIKPLAVALIHYSIQARLIISTASGPCYLVLHNLKETKTLPLLDVDSDDPITQIYVMSRLILVSRSGRIYVVYFKNDQLSLLVKSRMHSVVDVHALYGLSVYPHSFTTIAPEALTTVEHFNDPFTCRLKLSVPVSLVDFYWRTDIHREVYVDPEVLKRKSTYLWLKLTNYWKKTKGVVTTSQRFPVYYNYLRYHHTDSLQHLEPSLVIELLQLAENFLEVELANQCRQFIREKLSTEDLLDLYMNLRFMGRVKNFFLLVPWCVELDNFIQWFDLAEKLSQDIDLRRHVAWFVRDHIEQVVRHSSYRTLDLRRWRKLMKMVARVSRK